MTPDEQRRALAVRLGIDPDAPHTVIAIPEPGEGDRRAEVREATIRAIEAGTGMTVQSVDLESFPIEGGRRDVILFRLRR